MGSKALCITNMKEFFERNPTYTAETAFKARDMYFKNVLDRDKDYKYLQQADYFIKKIKNDGTVIRNIEGYAEEVDINSKLGAVDDKPQQFNQFNEI